MKWLDGITDSTDMSLNRLWEMVEIRGVWHAVALGVTIVRHSLVTEQQCQQPSGTFVLCFNWKTTALQ